MDASIGGQLYLDKESVNPHNDLELRTTMVPYTIITWLGGKQHHSGTQHLFETWHIFLLQFSHPQLQIKTQCLH